jgi:hypothetical protein
MSTVQVHFTFNAPFAVVVSRVDPTSKQESQVGAYGFGVITQSALPGTEWRFTEMGNPHPFQTYVTTDAPTQHVVIGRIIASRPGAGLVTHSPVTPGVATKLRFRLEQHPRVWRTAANPILTTAKRI